MKLEYHRIISPSLLIESNPSFQELEKEAMLHSKIVGGFSHRSNPVWDREKGCIVSTLEFDPLCARCKKLEEIKKTAIKKI